MNKSTLFLLIILFSFFSQKISAQCGEVHEGHVILTTQAEVNSFGAEGYCRVNGNLRIGSFATSTSITSLQPLNDLVIVDGSLDIRSNHNLISFNGLEQLDTINGDFTMFNNNGVLSMQALDFEYIGDSIEILANNNIKEIAGFDNIERVNGGLRVFGNDSLRLLSSFENISMVEGDLTIYYNRNLKTLANLDALTYVGGNLFIGWSDIVSMDGLDSLTTIEGDIDFYGNSSLISLGGLAQLSDFNGELIIRDNNELSDISNLKNIASVSKLIISFNGLISLDGLQNLTSINGPITINEPRLESLSEFSGITSCPNFLRIYSDSLTSFEGLHNLTSIGRSFHFQGDSFRENLRLDNLSYIGDDLIIDNNLSLINLSGMDSVQYIGGNIFLTGNSQLTSLEGLGNLVTLGESIQSRQNPSLTSLDGLENITTIGAREEDGVSVLLRNNFELTDCCAIAHLIDAGLPGTTNIVGNQTGCENEQTISSACNVSTDLTDLELSSIPSDSVGIYETTTASFTIKNNSLLDATNIVVAFSKNQLNIIDAPNVTQGTTQNHWTDMPTWNINVLAAGDSARIDLPVFIQAAEGFSLYAEVVSALPNDIDSSPNNGDGLTVVEDDEAIYPSAFVEPPLSSCITVFSGNVVLESQDEVDNFGELGYCEITGDLRIGFPIAGQGSTDTYSLASLSGLEKVGGRLRIVFNDSLLTLSGLENLESVGGDISVRSNKNIQNLNALNELTFIGGGMEVVDNDALIDLNGLQQIDSIHSYLVINANENLQTLEGLNSLEYIRFVFYLQYNPSLENLNGVESLKMINGEVSILDNPSLKNIMGLNHLQVVEQMSINMNNQLKSLNGLNQLDSVRVYLSVGPNASLETLHGLESLKYVGRAFGVGSCPLVQNLEGLGQLEYVGESVGFSNNDGLKNLDGLSPNLYTPYILFSGNDSLVNIDALEMLNPLTLTRLALYDNPLLDNCCAIESLITESVGTTFEIYNNNLNCDSPQAILEDENCEEDLGVDLELYTMPVDSLVPFTSLTSSFIIKNNGTETANDIILEFSTNQLTIVNQPIVSQGSANNHWLPAPYWEVGSLSPGDSATINFPVFTLSEMATLYGQVEQAIPADIDSSPGNGNPNILVEDDEAIFPEIGMIIPPTEDIDLTINQLASLETIYQRYLPWTLTVVNEEGGDVAPFKIGIYISDNDILENDDILLSEVDVIPAAGETEFDLSGTLEMGDIVNGNYSLFFVVDNGESITETNEGNNIFTASLSYENVQPPSADLELYLTSTNSNPMRFETFRVTYTLVNKGSGDAENLVFDLINLSSGSVVLSGDGNINMDSTATFLGSVFDWYIPFLEAGDTTIIEFDLFSNVDDLDFCSYLHLASTLDPDSAPSSFPCEVQTEDDEATLSGETGIVDDNGVDFFINNILVDSVIDNATLLNYDLEYSAIIPDGEERYCQTLVYFSTDPLIDSDDRLITNSDIIVQNTSLQEISGTYDLSIHPPGQYYVISKVDFYNLYTETKEVNNVFIVPIVLTEGNSGADVALTLTANETQVQPLQTVTYTLTAMNNGVVPLSGLNIDFDYGARENPNRLALVSNSNSDYDSWIGQWNIGNLAPGEAEMVTLELFVLENAIPEITLTAAVNSLNENDLNPNDNEASYTLEVIPAANMNENEITENIPSKRFAIQKLWPNPAQTEITLTISTNQDQSIHTPIEIYDNFGRLVYHEIRTLTPNMNFVPINIQALPAGIYQVVVPEAHGKWNQVRFVKVE